MNQCTIANAHRVSVYGQWGVAPIRNASMSKLYKHQKGEARPLSHSLLGVG